MPLLGDRKSCFIESIHVGSGALDNVVALKPNVDTTALEPNPYTTGCTPF